MENKSSDAQELMRVVRNLARLEREQRKLKRNMKKNKADLKLERRHRKALLGKMESHPDVMPSRLFGDGVGIRVKREDRVQATTQLTDDDI